MTRAKSERLVNLLILLLSARNFVDRRHIRETIEGYRGQSDAAFERMFERDKDELRAIGVPIITGTNHADSDESDGYRINRDEFELPPVSFTRQELAVLGAAAGVWKDQVAADETSQALSTLRAAGADPDPERLLTLLPRIEAERGFAVLRDAVLERREVAFEYRGQPRRVQPWWLQLRGGRWYLLGHDMDRDAPRHFKLARMTSDVTPVGAAGVFEPPPAREMEPLLDFDIDADTTTAIIALRAGKGGDLRRISEPTQWETRLPDGFQAHRVRAAHATQLVAEVCALGPDAFVLEPEPVRRQVIAQLRRVAQGWW